MKNLWLFFLVGLSTGFINEKIFVLSQSTSSTADDLYIEGRTSGDLPIDDEDSENDGSGSGSGDYAFTRLSDQEEVIRRLHDMSKTSVTKEMLPFQTQPTANSPQNPPTTVADSQDLALTEQDSDDRNTENKMPGMNPTSNWKDNSSPSNMPLSETTTQFKTDITVTKDVDDDIIDTWNGAATKEEVLNDEKDAFAEMGQSGGSHAINNPQEVTSENLWERTEVLAAVIACGVVGFLCAVFLLLLLAYRMKKKDEGSYDLGDTKLSATAYHKAPTKEFYA